MMLGLRYAMLHNATPQWEWMDGHHLYRGLMNPDAVGALQTSILLNFLPCEYGQSITVHWGNPPSSIDGESNEYDESREYLTYWKNDGTGERTFNVLDRRTKFIRVTIPTASKDIAFVMNNTTGEYLYKGRLV